MFWGLLCCAAICLSVMCFDVLGCTVMCVVIICVLRYVVLYCIVLQWDVVCDTLFSAVLYLALYAMWYCVVRFAEM